MASSFHFNALAHAAQASINNAALFLDFFKQGVELNAVRRVLQGVYVKMTFVKKRKTDAAMAAPIGFLKL